MQAEPTWAWQAAVADIIIIIIIIISCGGDELYPI
jgi:hypothetical protein